MCSFLQHVMSNKNPLCIFEKGRSNIYHMPDKLFDSICCVSFYIYLAIPRDCMSCPEQSHFWIWDMVGDSEVRQPQVLVIRLINSL